MRLNVILDFETSERAGAGGMYQIASVTDADTGKDLSSRVDVGIHFSDEDAGLPKYLRQIFGQNVTYEVVG